MPRGSKSDCYADLKARILSTDLAPGIDLDEMSLTERYGISRTPLREILQRLSGDGFVNLHANRGAKVASMDLDVMRAFFQTAPMVYANIARLAAELRTADQLEDLKSVQTRYVKALKDESPSDAAISNHRFHEIIGEMAHNAYLKAALDRLLIDHARMSQTFYRPRSTEETELVQAAAQQHDQMIAGLESRNAETLVDVTLAHWALSRDRMERYVRPDPLPVDALEMQE